MEEQLEDAESAREGNFRHIYSNSSSINYRLLSRLRIHFTNTILGLASQINTLNSRLSERQKRIDEAEAEKYQAQSSSRAAESKVIYHLTLKRIIF